MHALQLAAEVVIELIGKERRKRSQHLAYGHKAGVERLVSAELVLAHLLTPETFTVQTYVPVAEVVIDEGIDEAASTGRVIAIELCLYTFDERVQAREDPTVNLCALLHRHLCSGRIEIVDVGIECEETIRII